MNPFHISVIIPTHNRHQSLKACLSSLLAQTQEPCRFEVIVVDDGSTDGTALVVSAFAERSPFPVRLVRLQSSRGPGGARNAGIVGASGDLIAFVDDDVLVEPDWMSAIEKWFEDPTVVGMEGRTEVKPREEVTPFTHQTEVLKGGRFPTCNMIFRKTVLDQVGGFCERFFDPRTGVHFREDQDLAFRVLDQGGRIIFAPDVKAVHPPSPPTWNRPWNLARRYRFDGLLLRRHPRRFWREVDAHRIGEITLGYTRMWIYGVSLVVNVLFVLSLLLNRGLVMSGIIAGLSLLLVMGLHCRLIRLRPGLIPWILAFIPMAVMVPWIAWLSFFGGLWHFRNQFNP